MASSQQETWVSPPRTRAVPASMHHTEIYTSSFPQLSIPLTPCLLPYSGSVHPLAPVHFSFNHPADAV